MVLAVRMGRSQQQVACDFDVSPATVNRWVRHAHGQRLDRVDWSGRSPIPHTTQRTEAALEDLVLEVRSRLQADSDRGFFGAEAILEPSEPAESNRYPRIGPSTVSSSVGACGRTASGSTASPASGLVSAGGGPPGP